jgi:hypothetical protein
LLVRRRGLVGRATEAAGFFDQALAFETENTMALWGGGVTRVAGFLLLR